MPVHLEMAHETWHIYALMGRGFYHDVTLPVTTYMACKRSDRGVEHYERAWKRYLIAQQVVSRHPAYTGTRQSEPRVLYDPVRDDVYWLFKQGDAGDFIVSPRLMPELDRLALRGEPALPVEVIVPSAVRYDDEEKAG